MHTILIVMMILGGCEGDGRLDLADFPVFLACATGPEQPLMDPQCQCADLDGDGDSDLFDLGLFQLRFEEENPCGRVSGSCLTSRVTPGCSDAACCADVCAADPFCCNGAWDAPCVKTALVVCGVPLVPSNNRCQTPTVVTDGTTAFSNIYATTDGPIFECTRFPRPGIEIYADIWFTYTAVRTGLAIVSLCGSEYDTTLAIYNGSACPTQPQQAVWCSDDDCRDLESRIVVPVVQGQSYLIRVGGYDGDRGRGTLSIRCTADGSNADVCGPGSGDCDLPHRTPGCADVEGCEQQCDEDPSCCDVTWHGGCAGGLRCCVYYQRDHGLFTECLQDTCPRQSGGGSLLNSFPVASCAECYR